MSNLLRQRVTIHNQQICDPSTRMLKVSEHIANCGNALTLKYDISLFFKMHSESATLQDNSGLQKNASNNRVLNTWAVIQGGSTRLQIYRKS